LLLLCKRYDARTGADDFTAAAAKWLADSVTSLGQSNWLPAWCSSSPALFTADRQSAAAGKAIVDSIGFCEFMHSAKIICLAGVLSCYAHEIVHC